jgi:hypothetical protein
MEIIFVKTRWHYESYCDFWKLVTLSGFPTCYTDEIDISKEVIYLVSPYNGEWVPAVTSKDFFHRKARLYMLNLERPSGAGSWEKYIADNTELIQFGYFDDILVGDRYLADQTGFPYMLIGGHENFCNLGNNYNRVYDLITLSCYSLARAWMFQTPERLYRRLGGMKIAPNITASNGVRDVLLKGTKAMLNIHQDGLAISEPLRMILAVMYGLPIFTEDCESDYPCHKFSRFNDYAHVIKDMLDNDYDELHTEAMHTRELFTTVKTFRNCVLKAINEQEY